MVMGFVTITVVMASYSRCHRLPLQEPTYTLITLVSSLAAASAHFHHYHAGCYNLPPFWTTMSTEDLPYVLYWWSQLAISLYLTDSLIMGVADEDGQARGANNLSMDAPDDHVTG